MPLMQTLRLAAVFSLREMRAGLAGFFVFIACIALGTGAIGGVNSVAQAISDGVANEGQALLGGDLRFGLVQRQAKQDERAWLDGLGQTTESFGLRSMVRRDDGSDQALAEVRAVDKAWPLYGAAETEPGFSHDLFAAKDGVQGAIAPAMLLERLGVKPGEVVRLGEGRFRISAVLVREPDALAGGIGFAPRFLISVEGLQASGLIQPGSLYDNAVRVKLPAGADQGRIETIKAEAGTRFAEAGWSIRTRDNAAPSLSANIERFSQFLTLVGLTALLVGGVGVANAVRAYLDGKRPVIATFKSLGASGNFVFTVYFVQILMIAAIGIAFGLVLAALAPPVAIWALRDVLPVNGAGWLYPGALGLAAIYGVLATMAFAVLPLGHARDVPATALFREMSLGGKGWPRPVFALLAGLAMAALAGLAVFLAREKTVAYAFVTAAAFAFVTLWLVGFLVRMAARRAPVVRSTPLRLALGNIHRPGALTGSVVLSLGLGLTLLVTLSLIDRNLRSQISGSLMQAAPNFFFADVRSADVEAFSGLLAEVSPKGEVNKVPMLRGRITEFNGKDVQTLDLKPEARWVLNGDRGLTYSETQPKNSTIAEGTWWPANHQGEKLVSFSAEEAGELGLKVGDAVTVNVLGRNITAKIANLRKVDWETMGINFVMVFSPNTFAGAPHSWLATLSDKSAGPAEESAILNAVTRAYPAVTSVRVKDALDVVNKVVAQLATAIRSAAAVALIASVLVLSGALAAGNQARIRDAVILKTLGATRTTLMAAYGLEYALLGAATALFALFAGGVAAWFVTARIMKLEAHFSPEIAGLTLLAALVLTVGFGLAGTWRALGQKAAPVLRAL